MTGQHGATPAPLPLPGTRPLDGAAFAQLVRLTRRTLFRHELGRGALIASLLAAAAGAVWTLSLGGQPWMAALAAAVCAVAAPAAAWLAVPWFRRRELAAWSRPPGWVAGFFDDTATQLVHPDAGAWELSDHAAEHPGAGEAGPFRRRVFAHLASEADRLGVPITMSTRSRKLAAMYRTDMPGLVEVDPGIDVRRVLFGRQVKLRREPRPAGRDG